MYIYIPVRNIFDTVPYTTTNGYGYVSSGTFDEGFEIRKAFDTDMNSYAKAGVDTTVYLSYENNLIKLYGYSSVWDEAILLHYSYMDKVSGIYTGGNTWGDGEDIVCYGEYIENLTDSWVDLDAEEADAKLLMVSGNPILEKVNRMTFEYGTEDYKVHNLSIGKLIEVPDPMTTVNRPYKYYGSSMNQTTIGTVTWDGWANQGSKDSRDMEFKYLNTTQKNDLIYAYFFSRGGLPIWIIENVDDTHTWYKMKIVGDMSIKEPSTEYFDVNFTVEEI